MADAAQIEAMNKVRVSLGMAPLPVPGKSGPQFKAAEESGSEGEEDISTLERRAALADRNWQRLEEEKQEKREREQRKAAAKKARDAAQRFAKLEGKTLGDADEEEEQDTKSWLRGQKKRQKEIEKARKLAEELAEREKQVAEYTSKDLAGVKVGHEAAEFDEFTGEQILTLKDTEIGEESEDDELENAELRAKEKLEEKMTLKKKRPDYDPTEQSEAKAVLSKYDDEIDGKKQKRFTLDGAGSTVEARQKVLDADGEVKSKGVKISLDMLEEDAPISDYVDPSTIKVKKPKKKKEKKTRQKVVDDDDIFPVTTAPTADQDAMDVDGAQANGTLSKKRALEFDDDDLQARLAEQRRQALNKRKKTDAAELARQLREEMPVDEQEPEEVGLILDETTEFVANLKNPEEEEEETRRSRTPRDAVKGEDDEDGDTAMAGPSYADVEGEEERNERIKREISAPAEITETGLEDEDFVSGSAGATLAMLRKRGLVQDHATDDLTEKERQRNKFLADKQKLIDEYDARAREEREAMRQSGEWDRMAPRDRDQYARRANEQREQFLARLQADLFNRSYRPDVKLEYHDEFGRTMTPKEAFKELSHQFHGKGSGKGKTEKRLKKIEDEKRAMQKGVLHAGENEGGFMQVQGREGKRQKQAGVRLQ
jgi:U4/U6.U5 tri-snRNP-associated protein 1